jgi:hypothetical protein
LLSWRFVVPFFSVCLPISVAIGYGQTPESARPACEQVQVLTLRGQWMGSNPSRTLTQGACLKPGETVSLGPDAQNGEITIIYHTGDLSPHTVKCDTRAECNNAYQVESVTPAGDDSWWSVITRIIQAPKTRRVPGVLRGSNTPQPILYCGKTDLAAVWKAVPDTSNADRVTLTPILSDQSASPVVVAGGKSPTIFDKLVTSRKQTPMIMSGKIVEPGLYAVDTTQIRKENSPQLVAFAPQSTCSQIEIANQKAVSITSGWPADTPVDAVATFRAAWLEGVFQTGSEKTAPTVVPAATR